MSIQLIFPFTTSSNYIYGSNIEVVGGVAKLVDQRTTDATFFANYASNINGNWGSGTLTGTATGGATVSGGELDLAYDDIRYVDYDADGNADSQQTGCIRFRVTPNYSGSPSSHKTFFAISKENGSTLNLLQLFHKTTGGLQLNIYNSAGGVITAQTNVWVPTSGTQYEIEVNWDITAGATRIFIDGIQFGTTIAATGTRDANIGLFRIGSSAGAAHKSNFKINDFLIFSTVQHTANYTPTDWSEIPTTKYPTTNPTIEGNTSWRSEGLDGFTETSTKAGSDEVKYILKKGTTWYYYNSGWVESDGTYSQSNTAAEIETNKATFTTVGVVSKFKAFLHSDDGSTTPELDQIEIAYDYAGDDPSSVSTCIVYGYAKSLQNTVDTNNITVSLLNDSVRYKSNIVLRNETITVVPDSLGYWEVELIENENMAGNQKYIFTIQGKKWKKTVPNETTKNFWELAD